MRPDVATVEGIDGLADNLHVLPRHGLRARLVPGDSDVGQRALAIDVVDEPRHFAAAELEGRRDLRPHPAEVKSARLAAPTQVEDDQDSDWGRARGTRPPGTVLRSGAQEVTPAFRHPVHSSPGARRGPIGVHVFDLGMRPLGRVVVAALPGRADRADEVEVLRQRYASCASTSRPAGPGLLICWDIVAQVSRRPERHPARFGVRTGRSWPSRPAPGTRSAEASRPANDKQSAIGAPLRPGLR